MSRHIAKVFPLTLFALLLTVPSVAAAQGLSVHGSAGPTLSDRGYSLAGGLGVSPLSWLAVNANAERTHLPSRRQQNEGSVSQFRGGTFTLVSAELQVLPLGRDRIGPCGLAGFGAGRSTPNVNAVFPTPRESTVVAPFAGGGFQIPVGGHLTLFADARLMLMVGTEYEDLFAIAPVRAGFSWRF